jgi:DNA-binding response OmpR family regulator
MLTGHDEVTDRVKALDAGVDDYLIKPFSIDELMATFTCHASTNGNLREPI